MMVPESTLDHDIYQELDYAKSTLEETGIPKDWTTPDINDEILDLAAQKLNATWCYVGSVEFEYSYGGEYLEEAEEQISQMMRETVRNRLEKERRMQSE